MKFIDTLEDNFGIKLTDIQKDIIEYTEGPTLILSAAGSGKTTVNIVKCANLIIEHNVNPKKILALTFSRAAAKDMETRFEHFFKDIIETPIKFSTIHSFAYRIVNEYTLKNGIKLSNIEDSNSVIKKNSLLKELYVHYNHKRINDDKLDEVSNVIGLCKNMMISPQDATIYNTGIPNFSYIYEKYEKTKRDQQLIDFDDMLTLAYDILKKDEKMLNKYRKEYDYIIVDEAQDTSKIQFAIITMLAYPKNNLCIIADDDQSIYGFRGAFPDFLWDFKMLYKDAKIFYMEENFRCSKNIVNVANNFIISNKKRYNKKITTNNPLGSEIQCIALQNETEQLKYLKELLLNCNVDTAILYRYNISAILIADTLERAGITYYIKDYKEYFFKHWILEDIKAFFQLSENHNNLKAFKKIYYKINYFLPKDLIVKLEQFEETPDIFDYLDVYFSMDKPFRKKQIKSLRYSFNMIQKLEPYEAINYILEDLNYDDYLKKNGEELGYSYETLLKIVNTVINIAINTKTIREFIDRLEILKCSMEKAKRNKKKSCITLSTIHSVKGLEFSNVYIIDLIEGDFPSSISLTKADKGDISLYEEERRIFYVAITRAKRNLILLYTREKNNKKVPESSFLLEVEKRKRKETVQNKQIKPKKNKQQDIIDVPLDRSKIKAHTKIYHKTFGYGVITETKDNGIIKVQFDQNGEKLLSLSLCEDANIIKIVS